MSTMSKVKVTKVTKPMRTTSYTIDFPEVTWTAVKVLASTRGETIRRFLQKTVVDELRRARKGGELHVHLD